MIKTSQLSRRELNICLSEDEWRKIEENARIAIRNSNAGYLNNF